MTQFWWKNGDQTLIFLDGGKGQCEAEGGDFDWELHVGDQISLHFEDNSLLGIFANGKITIGGNQYLKSVKPNFDRFNGRFLSFNKDNDYPSNVNLVKKYKWDDDGGCTGEYLIPESDSHTKVKDTIDIRVVGLKAYLKYSKGEEETYKIDPTGNLLLGENTGTRQRNGEILWSNGHISRHEHTQRYLDMRLY